jgi:uncharacterized protein (DUF1015 family)
LTASVARRAILTPSTLHVVAAAHAPDLVPGSETASAGRFAPVLDAEDVGGADAGERAAWIVAGLLADGCYSRHPGALAIHELERDHHRQTGLVGAIPVCLVADGVVRGHEQTRADREAQLSAFLSTSGMDLDPVILAHRPDPDLVAAMRRITRAPADVSFLAAGTRHRIWIVERPAPRDALGDAAARLRDLIVIDGHHRVAAARRRHDGGLEPRFLAELVADDQLRMWGFDRRIRLDATAPASLLAGLDRTGTLARLSAPPATRPRDTHDVLVHLAGAWYRLALADGVDDPVDRLPVVALQQRVLGPLLGIDDPRTDDRIEHLPGTGGLEELGARTPPSHVLFVPPAVGLDAVRRVVDAGRALPPKSTYVDPKPGPAVFLRPHDHAPRAADAAIDA